jgi:hypothetical protein
MTALNLTKNSNLMPWLVESTRRFTWLGRLEILYLQRVFYLLLRYYSLDQSPFVD